MDAIVDAHMEWSLAMGDMSLAAEYTDPPDAVVQNTYRIKVVDLFSKYFCCFVKAY
jgi:hypothetical protein